jgi:hypothetical protein
MSTNTNVNRISSAAILADTSQYQQEEPAFDTATPPVALPDRLRVIADPVGQRGNVAAVTLGRNDELKGASHRCEISRDLDGNEYVVGAGGWMWTSYMLNPEWLAKYSLLEASVPATADYSINIIQYHQRNTEGTHPYWTIIVNEFGVCLRKWSPSDAAAAYELVAIWPVDSLVWHDMVVYVLWSTGNDGIFRLYKDDILIYQFLGPNTYPGSAFGAYWKSGIYAPGWYPTGLDELTLYSQGYKHVYLDGSYNECRGVNVTPSPPPRISSKLF